jgi:glycine/D-amino acid oxidase-like deaminating enzyme
MHVAIAGAGVIGSCLAYFLSLGGAEVTVVERTAPACAASGKSGGFLALDWCDGSPLAPLARRSFALHAELAASLGRDWGYRRMETFAVGDAGRSRGGGLGWLGPGTAVRGRLGGTETTAQIDPAAFTRAMLQAAIDRGARLRIGRVDGIARQGAQVEGLIVDGETLAADAVVIAMGPWSIQAAAWLPLPAVHALKGHSLVFRPPSPLPAQALFGELRGDGGSIATPELFPRADGTTYICGLSSEDPLPADPADVAPDPATLEALHRIAARMAPALADAPLLASGACHRPVSLDGLPLMGRIPGTANAFVSTGHSVWGMLNGPASGEAMAELIVGGRTSRVDLRPFDPGRLPPHRAG